MGEFAIRISEKNYKELDRLVNNAVKLDIKTIILDYQGQPSFKKLIPDLFKALDLEDDIEIFIKNIPYCILKNAEDHIINKKSSKKTRPNQCIKCKYKECGGIFNHYLENFGDSEINPILDLPEEVVIEITNKCNLDCYFCFNRNVLKQRGKELSKESIKKIINGTKKAGIKVIRFTGGEPLSHPDIFELLEYAKSKEFEVRLNTNGTLITEDIAKKLEKYVDNILVPLNSLSSPEDIKRIKALKLLKQTKIHVVRSGTIATKENIKNLEKIYAIIKDIGIKNWELYRPVESPDNKNLIDEEDIKLLTEKLIKIKRKDRLYPIANALPFCAYDLKKVKSIALGAKYDDGHARLVISPEGYAKPSYFIDKNIGDPTKILDCWNSKFMKDMRNLKLVPKQCKTCDFLQTCKGGSRFAARLHSGDFKARDPLMADL